MNGSLEPPETSGTDGGDTIRDRRRSSQISTISSRDSPPKALAQLFSGLLPGQSNHDESSASSAEAETEADEAEPGFLGGVTSYSRLLHAHTQSQLDSPSTGTLPAYSKSMHAFTINQLRSQRSKSETSSPDLRSKLATTPSKLRKRPKELNLDEIPHGPSNTPEKDGVNEKIELDKTLESPVGRRRSLTDPSAVKDFAVIKDRDLANIRPVAV